MKPIVFFQVILYAHNASSRFYGNSKYYKKIFKEKVDICLLCSSCQCFFFHPLYHIVNTYQDIILSIWWCIDRTNEIKCTFLKWIYDNLWLQWHFVWWYYYAHPLTTIIDFDIFLRVFKNRWPIIPQIKYFGCCSLICKISNTIFIMKIFLNRLIIRS